MVQKLSKWPKARTSTAAQYDSVKVKNYPEVMAGVEAGFAPLISSCGDFSPLIGKLMVQLRSIENQKLVTSLKSLIVIRPKTIFGTDRSTVDFADLKTFPLFEDKTVRTRLRWNECSVFDELKQEFLTLMRQHLGAKVVSPVVAPKEEGVHRAILARAPVSLDSPKVKKGFQRQYEAAVRNAVDMLRKGYSFDFSMRTACKKSGYPVLCHVNIGMRIEVGQDFIDERIVQAYRGRSNSGQSNVVQANPTKRTGSFKIFQEVSKNEKHFKAI